MSIYLPHGSIDGLNAGFDTKEIDFLNSLRTVLVHHRESEVDTVKSNIQQYFKIIHKAEMLNLSENIKIYYYICLVKYTLVNWNLLKSNNINLLNASIKNFHRLFRPLKANIGFTINHNDQYYSKSYLKQLKTKLCFSYQALNRHFIYRYQIY
jgi:hypothetical protein